MNSRLGLIALFTLLTSLTLTIPSPLLLGKKFERGNRVFAQTVTERKAEADRLLEQGRQQNTTSQYQAAIQSLETALNIYRDTLLLHFYYTLKWLPLHIFLTHTKGNFFQNS